TTPLVRLAEEFGPELRLLGLWDEEFQTRLDRCDRVCRDGRPQGVRLPLVRSLRRCNRAANVEGKRHALEEWSRGEAVFYTQDPIPALGLDHSSSLTYATVPISDDNDATLQMIAGHNQEVWRLLQQPGGEGVKRPAWLAKVYNLAETWR